VTSGVERNVFSNIQGAQRKIAVKRNIEGFSENCSFKEVRFFTERTAGIAPLKSRQAFVVLGAVVP
jgi:hypothetical protein